MSVHSHGSSGLDRNISSRNDPRCHQPSDLFNIDGLLVGEAVDCGLPTNAGGSGWRTFKKHIFHCIKRTCNILGKLGTKSRRPASLIRFINFNIDSKRGNFDGAILIASSVNIAASVASVVNASLIATFYKSGARVGFFGGAVMLKPVDPHPDWWHMTWNSPQTIFLHKFPCIIYVCDEDACSGGKRVEAKDNGKEKLYAYLTYRVKWT
uniref:Uncharacterized protein n=1 Tax=Echinococcus canadensis TaxID=519352 RepID=A0A915EVE6_9CEST